MVAVTVTDTHRAIDAVWRIESARLVVAQRIFRAKRTPTAARVPFEVPH